MRVHVDEAGDNVLAGRVDDAGGGGAGEPADGDDLVVRDADIGGVGGAAGTVEDLAAADEEVEVLGGGGGGEEGGEGREEGEGEAVHGYQRTGAAY